MRKLLIDIQVTKNN